ncbi:GNAT family N-acetyltransferase [Desulforamulus aquiferis]|uniref:N-acetyltransferase n=1 Tax=Desulforamulus aquiferis TaxID=1397668 RepID=A0AAW7ZAE7_9FIRM|nr:N-acetyltransferase [Desulforamulus aquiferis]MDO7786376.1 N-acetyltransferase [Desulforamulus aquiferis]RYD06699.1 hypothetical protein N752_03220 [Desulforamulus aquiferis]
MYGEEFFDEIAEAVELVNYSPRYRLGDFDCGIPDYNEFLTHDAQIYIEKNISQVKLLINKTNADVIGYISLNTDSFILDPNEKEKEGLNIPFGSIPALKIGKLAVCEKYRGEGKPPYGSFLMYLALGYLEQLNHIGIGCRFLVVDADITHKPDTPKFYEKNGFVYNEKVNKSRKNAMSMRYDVLNDFQPISE